VTQTLLTMTYRLRIPVEAFRPHAEAAGRRIAETPGLVWKIWGLQSDTRQGTSVYLFRDPESAEAFAAGPAIAEQRNGPADDLRVRLAPVDVALSTITGAAATPTATPMLEMSS